MTAATSDPRATLALESLETLERRGWRVVFATAAFLYLVGSHWPRLEMDPVGEGGPSPDKILHFIAFLLLTLPAWWTGWFRGLGTLWIAGLGFAVFDEVTQWLLPIERDLTLEDLLCDACGVTAAVAILAASGPMEDPRSRRLFRQRRLAEATLLAKTSNWLVLAATAALGIVVATPLAVLASGLLQIEARAMAVAGAALGAATAGLVALEFGIGATLRRLREAEACLHCGAGIELRTTTAAMTETEPDPETGSDAECVCRACGATRDRNAWFIPPSATSGGRGAVWLDAAWWPVVRAGLGATAVVLAMGWFAEAWRRTPDHATVARVVDLAVLVVAGAWAAHGIRRRLSRTCRDADKRCVGCGHDLHGLARRSHPVPCPECGTPFLAGDAIADGDRDSTGTLEGETMPR